MSAAVVLTSQQQAAADKKAADDRADLERLREAERADKAKNSAKKMDQVTHKLVYLTGIALIVALFLVIMTDPNHLGLSINAGSISPAANFGLSLTNMLVMVVVAALCGSSLTSARLRKQFVSDGILPILGAVAIFAAIWPLTYAFTDFLSNMVKPMVGKVILPHEAVPYVVLAVSFTIATLSVFYGGFDLQPMGVFLATLVGIGTLTGNLGALSQVFGVPDVKMVLHLDGLRRELETGSWAVAEFTIFIYVVLFFCAVCYGIEAFRPRNGSRGRVDPSMFLVSVASFGIYAFFRVSQKLNQLPALLIGLAGALVASMIILPLKVWVTNPDQLTKDGLTIYLKSFLDLFDGVAIIYLIVFLVLGVS